MLRKRGGAGGQAMPRPYLSDVLCGRPLRFWVAWLLHCLVSGKDSPAVLAEKIEAVDDVAVVYGVHGRSLRIVLRWRGAATGETYHLDDTLPGVIGSLRDVLGDPFYTLQSPLFPSGDSREIQKIARAIRQEGRYEEQDMLELADLLEDVGCVEEEILRHLRGWTRCLCLGRGERQICTYQGKRGHTINTSSQIQICPTCKGEGWRRMLTRHIPGCWAVEALAGETC